MKILNGLIFSAGRGHVDSGLSRRVLWYTVGYGNLVNQNANLPWGRGDSTQHYQVARRVGLRYYELSDHLGNVTATVLDWKTGVLASGSAVLYDRWKADVASLTVLLSFWDTDA